MKKFFVILISLFLITGCEKEVLEGDNINGVKLKQKEYTVYSDINLYDVLEIDNNIIENKTKDHKINTDKIGKKKLKFVFRFEGKNYVYKFSIDIVDKEAPRVIGGTNKTITKGYEGNLCDLLFYGDNYDGNVNCAIEGDYNVNGK